MLRRIDLSEFKLGKKQQAGVMSVYPLLSKNTSTELAHFPEIKFEGTNGYGNMIFSNESSLPFILPTGYAIMTKQKAQDHALPFSLFLQPEETRITNMACCIESTQGGYINGEPVTDFSILPLYIRKKHFQEFFLEKKNALTIKGAFDFSRLWDTISDFQRKAIKDNKAHLVYFFNKFMDKLLQFSAEFEVVEGQRGAVILIHDKIVGIEIAPSHSYFSRIWNQLIRDCYGSEIIRLAMEDVVETFETSSKKDLDISNCNSIKEIEKAIDSYYQEEEKDLILKLKEIKDLKLLSLDSDTKLIIENSYKDISYHVIKAKERDIYGELYFDKEEILYASLLF